MQFFSLWSTLYPYIKDRSLWDRLRHQFDRFNSMTTAEWWIVGCWVVFIAIWIATAADTKATVERQSFAARASYTVPVLLGAALVFHGFSNVSFPGGLGARIYAESATTQWLGFLAVVLGLAIAVWARQSLGRNWSSTVVIKQDHELVTRGPYSFVRHPIYTGLLAMFLGTALALGDGAAFLGTVLTGLGFWIKLRFEEQLMLKRFPRDYPDYQARVKRLIPFLW